MKRNLLTGITLSFVLLLQAQQKAGKVVYERVAQLQINVAGFGDVAERNIPQTRTEKTEVVFGDNKSLKRMLVDELPEAGDFQSGGLMIRHFGSAPTDITYHDFNEKKLTEQREFAGKKYLVSDSIRPLGWKITGESKTILGFACQQAIAQTIGKRISPRLINGKENRIETSDTLNIVAWFTPMIPVSAGPEYQGQLPGLILEININAGRIVYKALEISPKADMAAIKEPKSGKKITGEEFNKEREKIMAEMRRNNGRRGENIIIR